MSIIVYYNLYLPSDPARRSEIMVCYSALRNDPHVSRLIVFCETEQLPFVEGCREWPVEVRWWPVGPRPTFDDYFAAVKTHSGPNDVNVVINSDCFIDPNTTRNFERIRPRQAYCLSRHELAEAVPARIDRVKTAKSRRTHRYDMQDCWATRGLPRQGMWLDFSPGRPGCDNRLAYELQRVGYEIVDPCLTVRVLHYHRSDRSLIDRGERIPRPYAYPRKFGFKEAACEWAWWGCVQGPRLALSRLVTPLQVSSRRW